MEHSSSVVFYKSGVMIALLALALTACRSTNQPTVATWSKARVLAEKEDHPSKIVSDGEAVYFVTGGTVASQQEKTNNIKRISLKDGSVSVFVRGGDVIPDTTLAIDDKYVYWSDGGNILRVPKAGGVNEKIIPKAVILLAHDPRRLADAAALKIPLVLAGHTHGGQVVLPVVGALAAREFPVVAGLGRRDATTMFVSRGVGTVYVPVRINCPPEVAVLTLQPATA